jgi:hypothetical protein
LEEVLAELSVEEVGTLAKKFLIGQADVESGGKLQQVVDEDPTAALELLTQMQDALDHVTPYGLNPDQWKEVDAKVLPFIQGHSKKSASGLFGGLFGGAKKAGKPKASKVKRRSSSPVLTGKAERKPGEEKPVKEEPSAEASEASPEEGGSRAGTVVMILLLLAAASAGGAYWWFFAHRQPQPPKKAVVMPPTPTAFPSPTPNRGARRGQPPLPMTDAPIPAEIPPATPRPAGKLEKQ